MVPWGVDLPAYVWRVSARHDEMIGTTQSSAALQYSKLHLVHTSVKSDRVFLHIYDEWDHKMDTSRTESFSTFLMGGTTQMTPV